MVDDRGPAAELPTRGDDPGQSLRTRSIICATRSNFCAASFLERPNYITFAAAVEGLQEALGKLNDLVTARTLALPDEAYPAEEQDEGELVAEAERYARRLTRIGPFWATEAVVDGKKGRPSRSVVKPARYQVA